MNFILTEIDKLRNGHPIHLDETLSNRYTIHCQEPQRTKTAYCFSIPIRNIKTHDIVDLKFLHNKHGSTFIGSEAKISVTDKISLVNQYGQCDVIVRGKLFKKTDEALFFVGDNCDTEIRPTLNGIMLILEYNSTSNLPKVSLRLDRPFDSIRTNDRFFSIIREKFTPFITVSCIGTMNDCGKVLAPCETHNRKISDLEYDLTFLPTNNSNNRMAIEINMQETKLFQDTTVESQHPKLNNVFGGVSFLGESTEFGEQLLYSRLEISNISQIQNKRIINSTLHIPQLGYNTAPITVRRISERFCSLGSNWENKISITDTIAHSSASNGYYHLDITTLLGNFRKKSENFVITGTPTNKPIIIPTGDNFYTPQILEVRYQ